MKGRHTKYSPVELAWIEAHKTSPRREAHALFSAKFGRDDVLLTNYTALCKRNGWLTGRTGQWFKGQVSHNKGKKMPYNANSAATRFKKGHRPASIKYLGHERLSKDGYVEISVAQTNPHTGAARRYVQKHRHFWEQANGPVPKDMCLKCLDGDKTNTDPSNWELIPRAMLPRLNGIRGRGYEQADPEIKPVIMAIAKLEHKARTITKESKDV